MIGIAGPGELDPGVAHLPRERARLSAAARHRLAAIRIVEYKRNLRTMKRARPSAQDGSLPDKPIQVGRPPSLRRLQFSLLDRATAHAGDGNARPDIEWLGMRCALAKGADDAHRPFA